MRFFTIRFEDGGTSTLNLERIEAVRIKEEVAAVYFANDEMPHEVPHSEAERLRAFLEDLR